MLQVRVHHKHPLAARVPGPRDDCAAQATLPGARPTVQQADRHRASRCVIGEDIGSVVVAVVYDEDLSAQCGDRRAEALQERFHVAFLVARGNDHGEAGRAVGRRAVEFHWSGRLAVLVQALAFRERPVRPGGGTVALLRRSWITTHMSGPLLFNLSARSTDGGGTRVAGIVVFRATGGNTDGIQCSSGVTGGGNTGWQGTRKLGLTTAGNLWHRTSIGWSPLHAHLPQGRPRPSSVLASRGSERRQRVGSPSVPRAKCSTYRHPWHGSAAAATLLSHEPNRHGVMNTRAEGHRVFVIC